MKFGALLGVAWPHKRYALLEKRVEYHPALSYVALYSEAMSTLIVPLFLNFCTGCGCLSCTPHHAPGAPPPARVRAGGRNFEQLSDHDRYFINEAVNLKFQQSGGGKMASFVLLYAYPTLYIGEKVLGRTHWSTVEVFGGSSLFYFVAMALVGWLTQTIALG